MLQVNNLAGFSAGGDEPIVQLSHVASGSDLTHASGIYTISGLSFGAEDNQRYLIAALGNSGGYAELVNITSVSIGGVAATLIYEKTDDVNNNYPSYWGALVPTGASGNVVVSSPAGWYGQACSLYRAVGLKSLVPIDTGFVAGNNNTGSQTMAIDVPKGGIVLCANFDLEASANNFIGVTVDVNMNNYGNGGLTDFETGSYVNTGAAENARSVGHNYAQASYHMLSAISLR